ncbi:MAG: hypothetical protein KJT03_00445 [Verrucomicrobiae bacterium]|nr:hypothetical protein [Verrucomicrobiae bacterium]
MKKTITTEVNSRSAIQFLGFWLFYFSAIHPSFGTTDDSKNEGVNFVVISEARKLEIFAESAVQKDGYTDISFKIKRRSFKTNLDRIHADIEVYDKNGVLLDSFHDIFINKHVIRKYIGHWHRPKKYVRRIDFEKAKIGTIRITPYPDEQHSEAG